MRAALEDDISAVVNEFGPQLFEDFQKTRIIPPTSVPPPISPTMIRRRSTYGPQGAGTFFTHPMSACLPSASLFVL
jgi:glycerol-3-phosphate O-acyltransferase/dihydroxyacetone phosphate acyltransferase